MLRSVDGLVFSEVEVANNLYQQAVIDSGPVVYYNFRELSGTTTFDVMGNHNGTIVGTVAYNEPPLISAGACFELNGTDAYIAANGVLVYVAGDFTVECWVNCNDFSTDRTIWSFDNVGDTLLRFYIQQTTGQLFINFGASTIDTPPIVTGKHRCS